MPAPLQPTKIWRSDSPFRLEHGDRLPELEIAYETWGTLSPKHDNVLVVLHALTGSSHAFASADSSEPGWWEGLLGSHSAIDPERYHVICANLLGGCYGSTGPRSVDPRSGERFGLAFPQITLRDVIEAYRVFLKGLGIDAPVSLIGGSMGGMLVLQWAVDHPDEIRDAIALATPARSDAFAIALRSVQRDAILSDDRFQNGDYDETSFPAKGLALARKIAMITYRTPIEFNERFGRDARDSRPHFSDGLFEVQSYLNHQGKKFVDRFDPSTYLYFSRAMDLFDLAEGHDSLDAAVARIKARVLLLAMDSDLLVPRHQMEEIHGAMQRGGVDTRLDVVHTKKGHDAFLAEQKQILGLIDAFLGE
jgi:homoserine O-acetyltransferase